MGVCGGKLREIETVKGARSSSVGSVRSEHTTEPSANSSNTMLRKVSVNSDTEKPWSRQKVFTTTPESDGPKSARSHKSEADSALVRTAVQQSTLLGAMLTPQLEDIIDYMEESSFNTGQVIDLSGGMCVILEGRIRLRNAVSGGISAFYGKGDVVGEFGLLHSKCTGKDLMNAKAVQQTTRICMLKRSVYAAIMVYSRQQQITANLRLLSSIPIFENLSVPEKLKLADACTIETFAPGDTIVTEGEQGEHFYVLKSGEAKVLRKEKDGTLKIIDYKYKGDHFGDEALTKGLPRNATVIAADSGGLQQIEALRVDKSTFMELLGPICEVLERTEGAVRTLDLFAVPLLSELTAESREDLIKRLVEVSFAEGEIIFSQGEVGDKLFIIKEGEVSIMREEETRYLSTKGKNAREIDHLYRGQYFGERALLKNDPRMASAIAAKKLVCYSLSKSDFDQMALTKNAFWSRRWEKEDTRDPSSLVVIGMLGAGAFGTAWYVRHRRFTDRSYALKALEKKRMNNAKWRSAVKREKSILSGLPPHPNVIALYQTFQDDHHLFMLMEIAVGGELFKRLCKEMRFSHSTACFYSACVVLALSHLHSVNVIFRDLKPENLLISSNGYLKLIDMGFAKKVPPGEKTYTLCGTPYYLAPEMIKHKGHDASIDWWTLGVLTYEMIDGEPPFQVR
ncbi:hypothetical protein AB1Y20_003056 [Prymnesium parvum]|uniref:cGMP-dependent protein kinase n=1 Tax=Prymnesium parvum TaxID=97485 RepID=A0AB34JCB7_PRYPA